MNNASSGQKSKPPTKKANRNWGTRLITYAKRKTQERRTKKQQEVPSDRAARRTATATYWIAGFTIILAVVSYLQWREVHEGGKDTHDLAGAALAANRAWLAPGSMHL